MTFEKIRSIVASDIDHLKLVVDSSELFPSEYLPEMTKEYLDGGNAQDIWFTFVEENTPVAIGYCAPEKFTMGTFNLLAIGVKKDFQGRGIASEMMKYIERLLSERNGRILIVETSSDSTQSAARSLYRKNGYIQEAVIRDFWKEGEDKVVFWKKLW